VIYIIAGANANLEWYRIFLHTARAGNLTQAARELHVTQPSVSYAIKQLEELLGVKLFDRLSKGVRTTPEGEALLEYVERSFSLLESAERKIASLKSYASGELRIGANGPIIKHLLLPALDKLRSSYPDIRIRLSQGNTADLTRRLKEGRIDLGIVHLPIADPDLTVVESLAIRETFVVGPAYRSIADRPASAADLAKLPLLLLSRGSSTRDFIEGWFSAQGVPIEVDIELNSSDMLVELALRGYGAACVTKSFVQDLLDEGKLFELRTAEAIPERRVGIATRRDASPPLIAGRFLKLLLASEE